MLSHGRAKSFDPLTVPERMTSFLLVLTYGHTCITNTATSRDILLASRLAQKLPLSLPPALPYIFRFDYSFVLFGLGSDNPNDIDRRVVHRREFLRTGMMYSWLQGEW